MSGSRDVPPELARYVLPYMAHSFDMPKQSEKECIPHHSSPNLIQSTPSANIFLFLIIGEADYRLLPFPQRVMKPPLENTSDLDWQITGALEL